MKGLRLLLACLTALACARGESVPVESPDAAVASPSPLDAGVVAVADGGAADVPDASFPTGIPDPGDLSFLTAAPPQPEIEPTCDLASVTPAPPGRHPGPCTTLGLPGDIYSPSVFAKHDTYADGRLATEQREQWSPGLAGYHASYSRTTLENVYDGTGRLERAIKRTSYFTEPGSEFNSTSWEQIDYLYRDKRFSTRRMTTFHRASGSVPSPRVVELDDFVVDALGKVILTRQRWLDDIGGGYDHKVTFHPNGVEAAESWQGHRQWYDEDGASQFDDAGNPLLEDRSSFRGGNGTNRWHIEYTYEAGRLTECHTETGLYSDWPGEPLLGGARFLETYIYDGADPAKGRAQRLTRVDTKATDGSCTINNPAGDNNWVSTCTWTDRPEQQHAAFRYDDYGNLIERTVTNDAGNEISRWTAVVDKDGNLLCEKQTAAGVLRSFSRYDYSCW